VKSKNGFFVETDYLFVLSVKLKKTTIEKQ